MSTDSLEALFSTDDNNFYDDDFIPHGVESSTEPEPEPDPTEPAADPDPEPDPSPNTDSELNIDSEPKPDPKPDSADPTEPTSDIQAYYDFLVENNMLQPNEGFEFDGTAKTLSSALEQTNINTQRAIAQNLWSQLPDDFKPLLEYGLSGGSNPQEFLKTYQGGTMDVTDADLDDPATQEMVLTEYYKQTTSFNDEKINKLINTLKNKGEVAFTAEVYDAAIELKDIQKSQRAELIQQAQTQKVENEKRMKAEKEEIFNVVDSLELTPQRKGMIKSFIYANENTPSRMDSTIQSIINNKEHFAQLADLLLDYDAKTGFKIEDRFTKKGKTSAMNDLEKRLNDKFSDSKTKVSGAHSTTEQPNFDWSAIFSQPSE